MADPLDDASRRSSASRGRPVLTSAGSGIITPPSTASSTASDTLGALGMAGVPRASSSDGSPLHSARFLRPPSSDATLHENDTPVPLSSLGRKGHLATAGSTSNASNRLRGHMHNHRSSGGGFLLQGPLGADAAAAAGTGRPATTPAAGAASRKPSSREGDPLKTKMKPTASAPSALQPALPLSTGPDLDSAQIVNMALNLSESRRLAARRSAAYQVPPRLAPLPDSTVGGSLRHQLQQQRRLSQNNHRLASAQTGTGTGTGTGAGGTGTGSPRQTPRVSSSGSGHSLQPGFEPYPDGGTATTPSSSTYRYHFTPSTLARAQKAKDHLELQAQQRRLLDLIPPLAVADPDQNHAQRELPTSLGRPYNPLQYIRNRKVRVRERKAIDGQAQGFGDVVKTTDWVDEVERQAMMGQCYTTDGLGWIPPPFAGANEAVVAGQQQLPLLQGSPGPGSSSSSSRMVTTAAGTTAKPKRPRIDWVVDPADMIADVYWLEQDDNKKMVEDRCFNRVFPQESSAYRPLSRSKDENAGPLTHGIPGSVSTTSIATSAAASAAASGVVTTAATTTNIQPEHLETVIDEDVSLGHKSNGALPPDHSTRDRARQKLHELRGLHHHRQSSALLKDGHDRRRLDSFTDSSDSEGDRKRAGRLQQQFDPATAAGAEMLRRQMMDLLVQEKEKEKATTTATATTTVSSPPPTAPSAESPVRSGRPSLEVPTAVPHASTDYDSSQPTSPEIRPLSREGLGLVPALGGDLSPQASRPASPHRHRFSKVRNIFRDHSRENGDEKDEDAAVVAETAALSAPEDVVVPAQLPVTTAASVASTADIKPRTSSDHKRLLSKSPSRKAGSFRGSVGPEPRHHQHQRSEDSGLSAGSGSASSSASGLRAFLRSGPRIDTVLRSGVSKVSDMLWRRVPLAEMAEESTSSTSTSEDEEDGEEEAMTRGRSRNSAQLSRSSSQRDSAGEGAKHYLDIMPKFTAGDSQLAVPMDPLSRPESRQSARFNRLKPPRIDIEAASPSDSVTKLPEYAITNESDVSENESQSQSQAQSSRAGATGMNTSSESSAVVASSSIRRPRWSVSQPSGCAQRGVLSRRELARLRASLLSSAVLAKELTQHANKPTSTSTSTSALVRGSHGETVLTWADIATFDEGPMTQRAVTAADQYLVAAQVLGSSVQRSEQAWQETAEQFSGTRAVALRQRVDAVRTQVAIELSGRARRAADEADEVSRDLVAVQRLRVKRVADSIETMLRRRRRRFRWVRRAGWLTVEWVVVGFMWYVWFVVMLARVVLGAVRGVYGGVRWLLWL